MKRITNLLLVATVLVVAGCAHHQAAITIAPHSVTSTGASFDENQRNSGIISADQNGFVVTKHFIDRHGIKPGTDGVTREGKNFRITAQLMSQALEADRQRKNQQK